MIILERNYRLKQGEIDLIAKDGDSYVFCEVKYRSSRQYGYPAEAVTPSKQKTIRNMAMLYMMKNKLTQMNMRFDVVGILGNEIQYIPNAF